MAKTLYLLRHAQAASALNGTDKDRPLSAHGIEQAKVVGQYLKDININKVICSSAERTRMTLNAVQEGGTSSESIEYSEVLYNAPAGDILNVIQSSAEDNILVIAHNPGIHMLANMLVDDKNGDAIQVENLKIFYRPATLSIIECNIDNWADIQPSANKLTGLILPD